MDRMVRHSSNEENCGVDTMLTDENSQSEESIKLHWNNSVDRRGLGNLITKGNHIALTVSDIGRSLWFYTDVLGLQQIRRPNFDRHGAWLTMGNIELHLILGIPVVPSGKDLIVGHISLEPTDIGEVRSRSALGLVCVNDICTFQLHSKHKTAMAPLTVYLIG